MRIVLILSLLMFFLAATAMADAIIVTTSSSGVYYAVNDNGFYVQSTPIEGTNASAYISGSNFIVSATGPGYSDAGIVIAFTGGLDLDDLQSVTVNTDDPSAVNINIWLDTGGDGRFFQFDANNLLTSLDSDSYGSCGNGGVLGPSTTCFMQGFVTGSYNYTLAQLQNGDLSGINGETGVALWVGVTNGGSGTASISSVTVSGAFDAGLVPEPGSVTLVAAMAILIGLGRMAYAARSVMSRRTFKAS